jgi:hypothetical protein
MTVEALFLNSRALEGKKIVSYPSLVGDMPNRHRHLAFRFFFSGIDPDDSGYRKKSSFWTEAAPSECTTRS